MAMKGMKAMKALKDTQKANNDRQFHKARSTAKVQIDIVKKVLKSKMKDADKIKLLKSVVDELS